MSIPEFQIFNFGEADIDIVRCHDNVVKYDIIVCNTAVTEAEQTMNSQKYLTFQGI